MFDQSSTKFASLNTDLIVVGGGLGGLIAAAKVVLAGRSVLVLEQARHWGGRAATQVKEQRHLNLGPHALYCDGHAFRMLKELEVPFTGRFPNPGQSVLFQGKQEHAFPVGIWSLLTSRFLKLSEKWTLARLLKSIPQMPTESLEHVSLQTWIEQQAGKDNLASFLRTMFRLGTFIDDAEQLSAATALEQQKIGMSGNVWYLDSGWQSIVDGLQQRAKDAGAEFRSSASVKRVTQDTDGVTVTLSSGEVLRSRKVILAVPPVVACKLLELPDDAPLARWTQQAIPVHAACLDVCLSQLSRPDHRFALGLDRSVYYSVHSAAAKLAPEGVAVVQVMKYLREDAEKSYSDIELELEAVLDQMQPGWRAHTVERRYLPGLTVSNCLPTAAMGGLSGRPAVRVDGASGVFLCGDWVGSRGILADASAASAEEAANDVLSRLQDENRPALGRAMYVGN